MVFLTDGVALSFFAMGDDLCFRVMGAGCRQGQGNPHGYTFMVSLTDGVALSFFAVGDDLSFRVMDAFLVYVYT
jgi:hypothetical protein